MEKTRKSPERIIDCDDVTIVEKDVEQHHGATVLSQAAIHGGAETRESSMIVSAAEASDGPRKDDASLVPGGATSFDVMDWTVVENIDDDEDDDNDDAATLPPDETQSLNVEKASEMDKTDQPEAVVIDDDDDTLPPDEPPPVGEIGLDMSVEGENASATKPPRTIFLPSENTTPIDINDPSISAHGGMQPVVFRKGGAEVIMIENVPEAWTMDVKPFMAKMGDGHKCKKCSYRSTNRSHVDEHIRQRHYGAFFWQCAYCSDGRQRQNEMEKHVRTAHPGYPLRIVRCKPWKHGKMAAVVDMAAKTPGVVAAADIIESVQPNITVPVPDVEAPREQPKAPVVEDPSRPTLRGRPGSFYKKRGPFTSWKKAHYKHLPGRPKPVEESSNDLAVKPKKPTDDAVKMTLQKLLASKKKGFLARLHMPHSMIQRPCNVYVCPVCRRRDQRRDFIVAHVRAVHRNIDITTFDPDKVLQVIS